jgi:hypothetical protein
MEVQSLAFARSEVVSGPAVTLRSSGPVINVSRANLVPSTLPFQENNVKFAPGEQPPSSDYGPLPTGQLNPTSTGANIVYTGDTNLQGTPHLLRVPLTSPADPSTAAVSTSGAVSSTGTSANGAISAYSSGGVSATTSGIPQSNSLDLTA